ncbi:2Fe-2S iron-sulfur cluster binding domain-containing protein [Polaribacter litorisediminis]|uniref:2Fe-2S iron-sulfur cluster-binding protein n=1 Tax=Polaribacter litorisediminis TaxID=1908341 RepID=UPI001CC01534|nr:2Fe-2S iron-sulfur cluster-binding protein [Polaribacter litorisediminis]UAM97465.1 2Fe-2S iron-sulfur cluster binding domain-containing protein [Polaribacter litorisediminis]
MATFHKVHIQEVKQETANAVSVLFKIPENLQSDFKFTSGQYVTLQKEINGTEIRRAYSICSTPKSGAIRVSIKAVENGIFSTYATSHLKEGDEIEITAPEGRFLLNPEPNKNYIAFAAGSGITPILSMVKSVLENESSSSFTLVYGNKTVADTMFYDELNALKEKFSGRFKLHYIFSRENVKNQLQGRIDKSVTNYFVKNMYKETSFDAAFICGPEEMIHEVSKTLESNKIAKENIHFELFTVSIDEEAADQVKEGTTQITVLLDDEKTTFTMQQTDDILAASLRNELDPPYSCQGGVCSSCLAKVTEGKAVMVKNSILTDSEVAEGFILTCQAHPTTSTITIDFDDV